MLRALLTVAYDIPAAFVSSEAARIAGASRALASGDAVMARSTLQRYELRPLSTIDAAVRLMLADRALRVEGVLPRTMLAELGLDDTAPFASGRRSEKRDAESARLGPHLAKYSPDQPRTPAGHAGGGRWIDGKEPGDPMAAKPWHLGHGRFGIPDENALRHRFIEVGLNDREAMEVLKEIGRFIRNVSPDVDNLVEGLPDQLYEAMGVSRDDLRSALRLADPIELPAIILSAFDPPKPLQALKTDKPPRGFTNNRELLAYVGRAPRGYEWHHVIPQK